MQVEIARQLTMKVWLPFSKLKPPEFFNSAWSKPKLAHLAPNLLQVIAAFNDVGRWVATALLKQPLISNRTKMLEKLIKVSVLDDLFFIHLVNFFSFFPLIALS